MNPAGLADDIRFVLKLEEKRIGAVSAGVLRESAQCAADLQATALKLHTALRELRRWVGDGEFGDHLHRDLWTSEYGTAILLTDDALAAAGPFLHPAALAA